MSQVIPFPTALIVPLPDVAALSARLFQVESAETEDEELLDLLLEAEAGTIEALSNIRAETVPEVLLKLSAVVRRAADDRDGPLSDGEIALLRSILRDLQKLSAAPALAAARA